MVSTASGIFTFCNEVQSKNILSPSVVSVSGRVMFESAVQPLNTSAPSEVTPSGMEISSKLSQSSKALSFIFSSPVPKVTLVSAVQPLEVKVVLDAGHGGDQPGCVINGATEKDITLSIQLHKSDAH